MAVKDEGSRHAPATSGAGEGPRAPKSDKPRPPEPPGRDEPTSYWEALRKFIPVETVSGFLLLWGIYNASDFQGPWLGWVIFWVVLAITIPVVLARTLEEGAPWLSILVQVLIALGAYTLWTLSVGGPLARLDSYHPVYGTLGAAGFAFAVPVMTQELPKIWRKLSRKASEG